MGGGFLESLNNFLGKGQKWITYKKEGYKRF